MRILVVVVPRMTKKIVGFDLEKANVTVGLPQIYAFFLIILRLGKLACNINIRI